MGNETWNGRIQILSLDGGGVKGLFSAAILDKLEQDLDTHIHKHFDLIVGTSTGGLIALALGMGVRPRELVDLYREIGRSVFGDRIGLRWLQHWVRRKYGRSQLEKALKDTLGEETLLGASKNRLVIPSYSLDGDSVHLFKTAHHPRFTRDHKIPAWKVGLATSAAPSYFSSYDGVDGVRLVDGGVWANNPTLVAVTEAVGVLGAQLEDVHVLSVGTTSDAVTRSSRLSWAGKLGWASKAPDLIMRGQSAGANAAMSLLIGDRHTRIDEQVPEGLFLLDKTNASGLESYASQVSRTYAPAVKSRFLPHTASAFTPFHKSTSK